MQGVNGFAFVTDFEIQARIGLTTAGADLRNRFPGFEAAYERARSAQEGRLYPRL